MSLQVFVTVFSFLCRCWHSSTEFGSPSSCSCPCSQGCPSLQICLKCPQPTPRCPTSAGTTRAGLGSLCSFTCSWSIFIETSSSFYDPDSVNLEFKSLQLCLCQEHPGWFICLVLTSPFVARLAVKIFFSWLFVPVLQLFKSLSTLPSSHWGIIKRKSTI